MTGSGERQCGLLFQLVIPSAADSVNTAAGMGITSEHLPANRRAGVPQPVAFSVVTASTEHASILNRYAEQHRRAQERGALEGYAKHHGSDSAPLGSFILQLLEVLLARARSTRTGMAFPRSISHRSRAASRASWSA